MKTDINVFLDMIASRVYTVILGLLMIIIGIISPGFVFNRLRMALEEIRLSESNKGDLK